MFSLFPLQRVVLVSVFSVLLSACGGDDETTEVLSDTGLEIGTEEVTTADSSLLPDAVPEEATNDDPSVFVTSIPTVPVVEDEENQVGELADIAVESSDLEASDSVQIDTLSTRDVLPPLNLPLDGSTVGDYRLVNAYPELSFNEALLIAAVPGEDRLVVVEQTGLIKVFDDDPQAISSDLILDISENVAFSGEQGLLGLAFDPDFESNRFVYLNYTTSNPDLTVVSRMIWDAVTDELDVSSEQTVITVEQPFHSHNAGMIAFGPDNYLYIALGDGGDGGDPNNFAQDRSSLLGSLLRIDVHPADASSGYAIPPDNPFVGEPGVREEIFAYGKKSTLL